MAAEGEHGAIQGGQRIDGGLAILVDAPAQRNLLAGAAMQVDLAARGGAGGEVEDERRLVGAWPAEGNGVGAEQRLDPAGRRYPGVAGGEGQGHQPLFGEGFDFRPEGGEVHAAVDRQDGDALATGLFHQQRQAGLEGALGEGAMGVDAHYRRCSIENLGLGGG
ncbi:hypothetical protein FQZ97_986800 [compost metagenome]